VCAVFLFWSARAGGNLSQFPSPGCAITPKQ
jgi:hypothetical protein